MNSTIDTIIPTTFTLKHQGRDVFVEISPCSWMYAGNGLQIKLSTVNPAYNAESVFDRDEKIKATVITREGLLELAKAQALRWLEANGLEKLDAAVAKWAEDSVRLQAAIDKEKVEAHKSRVKRLTDLKAKGYTHVIDGWIHPKTGGDDYLFETCTRGIPTTEDLRKILAKSSVKNDYKVSRIADILNPPSQQ